VRERLGRWLARFATDVVVRVPGAWRLFRGLIRMQFDRLAPVWDQMRDEVALAPFEAALAEISEPPRRALDLGTGTGTGAFRIARRFGGAEVVGVDVAEKMLARARANTPPELDGRMRFERADAAHLPYGDASFDLVAHSNMIPFFDEVTRVLRPGGRVLFAFSSGPQTPIYVPTKRLRRELEARGFTDVRELSAGRGTAVVARKREST
jgi:ubiquinone/menaquinone biosynthesis C-methylase UbiE